MQTVKEITFNLLRKLGVTTIVGNPGSTEETFLKEFPADFDYVMALQESSVVAIADGLSQSLRKPVIVNIHTGAGLGNAMGCILTAYQNKTPLIITAGQQTREMLLSEPLLTNIEPTIMPKPWVKWSYEPARPEDVPGAFMRAYATAMQQPQGPVFLSLPLDDWDQLMPESDAMRTVSTRQGPDPDRLMDFVKQINASKNPVLIYGSDIARSQAWQEGITFAELLGAPVWAAPFAERTPFPEDHALFQGALTSSIGSLEKQIAGHDLVIVIGAPVFRYYPWISGQYIPEGSNLLQVSDDPNMTSKAVVGDSLVSDSKLFLAEVIKHVTKRVQKTLTRAPMTKADRTALPLLPHAVLEVLKENSPDDIIVTEECPSIVPLMQDVFRINKPDTFYTFSSGALGWGLPASVGLALGQKSSGTNRPVLALMGDGSFQYSVQGIYTGVQQKARVIYVVFQNEEYGILKQFASLEKTPHVPGLDLPGLDIVALGKGYGAETCKVESLDALKAAYLEALAFEGTSVIVVPITKELTPLFG